MNNDGSVFIKVHENVKEKLCMYQTTTLKIQGYNDKKNEKDKSVLLS